MKYKYLSTALLSCLFLVSLAPGVPLTAQDFSVDPETGKPKLAKENPDVRMELIFGDGSYSVGKKTFAIAYDPVPEEDWTLPELHEKTALPLNKAFIAVNKGNKDAIGTLTQAGVKAVPYYHNLLSGNIDDRKNIAGAASKAPSANGQALAFRMLMSDLKEVRDPAWQAFDKFSQHAKTGLWVHNKNLDVRKAVAEKVMGPKDNREYQKFLSELGKRDPKNTFKQAFSKNAPNWLANLYIDLTLDLEELHWDERSFKMVEKMFNKSKADKTWKLFGAIRYGTFSGKYQKLARNEDWYLRAAYCRALRQRRDLAWNEDVIETLLERQRDLVFAVRLEANRTLRALHPIPLEFKRDRTLISDSDVIVGWQTWWEKQRDLAKQFAGIEKEKPLALKKQTNAKVFWGASPQNYDIYKGKDRDFGSICLIDVDGDGKFTLQIDRYCAGSNAEKTPNVPLSRVLSNGKNLYLMDLDPETLEVRFKKYKGKTHDVVFESTYGASHKAVGVAVSSAPDMHFLVNRDGKTTLPIASYRMTAGWVIKKGSEAARILDTKVTGEFEINKDVETISYGSHLALKLRGEFDADNNMIILHPVEVVGQAGEIYRKISPKLDLIQVGVHVGEKKDKERRDWTPNYLNISTAMLGGLNPPLEDGQIHGYRGLFQNYDQAVLDLLTLQLEMTTLQALLIQKQAELAAAQAATPPDQPTIDALQAEVDDLNNVQIPAKQAEIDAKTQERDTLYGQLVAGGGSVGLDFEAFRNAVNNEEGVKYLARALSDIYWLPYEIDLSKVGIAKGADKVTIKLNCKLSFGDIGETVLEIDLAPQS